MKKKRKARTLVFLGTVGVLTTYIGSQLNSVKHRYEVIEKSLNSPNYLLNQLPTNKNIKSKEQLHSSFNIIRKSDNKQVGTCVLYFGQEETSHYNGHIVVTPNIGETSDFKKEVTSVLIHLAKTKMMSHLYFVASSKDLDSISEFEDLGAKFTKVLHFPETHPNYGAKQEKIRQYRLTLTD